MTRRPWAGMPDVARGDYAVADGECLDDVLGFQFLDWDETSARGRVEVVDRVRQRFGLVHGGVYAGLAELLATEATVVQVWEAGEIAMGVSNDTSFLRPIRAGTVHATARRRSKSRTIWVWDVDLADDDGRLCAVSRVTVAVRPRREAGCARRTAARASAGAPAASPRARRPTRPRDGQRAEPLRRPLRMMCDTRR